MPSFTAITKPSVGDPTELDVFAWLVIDDLNYLFSKILLNLGEEISNGSFEADTPAADTAPAEWTLSLPAGNHCSIETAAASVEHGAQSFSMTTPGSITGGVSLITDDFYAVGELEAIYFSWFTKSTVAGIRNQVFVHWYDHAQSLVSTTTLLDSTSNPTSWTLLGFQAQAPTTARFYKLELVGVNNSTAGKVYWDGISIRRAPTPQRIVYTSTTTYTAPFTGKVRARMWAGGGGGGGGSGGGTNGSNGTDGGDTWIGNSANNARGGKQGVGATGGANAAGPASQAPVIAADLVQYGSYQSPVTVSGNAYQTNAMQTGFGLPASANGGSTASGTVAPAGQDNTGQGGGGGSPISTGKYGGPGAPGEYAEYELDVTVGDVVTITIGAGGSGGGGGSGGTGSQTGGAGGKGLMILTEVWP